MKNILEYLERTAARLPGHVAVDDGSICLTWKELLDLSKRLGTSLCGMTGRGKPVVILMEKSAVTLAVMFGAVYAGCFYVMVDPAQPEARMQKMFEVLQPELVVTDKEHEKRLNQVNYKKSRFLMKNVAWGGIDEKKLQAIRQKSEKTDLLYGLFTSGSTGEPKLIVVSHQAAAGFVAHFVNIFGITRDDRIGNQAPFDFDVSVKDIYASMMTGATLVLIPKELFSVPPVLLDYLCEKRITALIWAVSALSLVAVLKGLDYKVPSSVKKVLFSGEVMPVKQLRMWQEALPEAMFVNLYGPTEITCNCTYYPVKRRFQDGEKLPIGRAFPGREVFLLDEEGKEVAAPGGMGEICVAGEYLSEGYYRNPEETKKRFMGDSLRKRKYQKCYRTGDLGYYGEDGELYFSGRKDFQIKHMGHRIELEEIEQALERIDGLERSCCLMDSHKNRLVAFYLGEASPEQIREYLKGQVPSYMIPHRMIRTNKMPLNKNGKMDRAYFRYQLEAGV